MYACNQPKTSHARVRHYFCHFCLPIFDQQGGALVYGENVMEGLNTIISIKKAWTFLKPFDPYQEWTNESSFSVCVKMASWWFSSVS